MSINKVENRKSVMMDHVLEELQDTIASLIVKKGYMANRQETLDYKRNADEYIAAYNQTDVFYTYHKYSRYALEKAGLFDLKYERDKTLIPLDKRDEVLSYQREYIIATYNEPNNYYRALAGIPDINDEPIYLTKEIQDVDITKPVHEFTQNEITIITVLGVLDELKAKYPGKKYLDHLDSERRIPIHIARKAKDFDILYIKKDRTKQGVSDMFIGLYRQVREYVLERFYDEAYKRSSPYYDAFIGIFILCITIQRYFTNYFHNYINRDFFNKDIIRLLFESYGLPFYNEIPLSYLQKTAKNLNRLLYYKATDHVFVDIFKIFDLDNINIYNYILFKDRKLDSNNKPVEIYKEKTELGYEVDTLTYELKADSSFYGSYLKEHTENIKKITQINGCYVYLLNSGLVHFTNVNKDSLSGVQYKDFTDYVQFTDNFNIVDVVELKGKTINKLVFITKDHEHLYVFDNRTIVKHTFERFVNEEVINEMGITIDPKNDTSVIWINTSENGYLYIKGDIGAYSYSDYTLVETFKEGIIDVKIYDESMLVVDGLNVPYAFGENPNYRLHLHDSRLDLFTSLENKIFNVKETHIYDLGSVFIMVDGNIRYTGKIPELGFTTLTSPAENELTDYTGVKTIKKLYDGTKNFYIIVYYNNLIDILNYRYSDKYGRLLFKEDITNPSCAFNFIRDINTLGNTMVVTLYKTESYLHYSGENNYRLFPFIRTMSMVTEPNTMKLKDVEIYNNLLYFITEDNRIVLYENNEYRELDLGAKEQIQRFKQTGDSMYVLVGKNYYYKLNEESGISKIAPKNISGLIIDINVENNVTYIYTTNNKVYKLGSSSNTTEVEYHPVYYKDDNVSISITPAVENGVLKFTLAYTDKSKATYTKKVNGLYNCRRVVLAEDVIIIDGSDIYFIRLDDVKSSSSTITANIHEELSVKRKFSEKVNNELIIYNKSGGLTLLKNFTHIDKLDSYIEGDYISLYDSTTSYISDITFSDTDILLIEHKNTIVTFEPVVEKMYDLKFIEVPIDTDNMAEQFIEPANYLDYGLVVDDDRLWGGDGDKEAFLQEVLNSEFNYVTSKYISVNCRYDLTKLNFEICYMFRMLTELKVNEKYMNFDVPYVGKVNLFDCIVGLYALTCLKFGFEGTIMDTTTKTLSVLGFNFNQDMKYIQQVVDAANFKERAPYFNKDLVEIKQPPSLFNSSAEVVNLYLNNIDVVEQVYDYKWNAKTIEEYNAFKRIEDATIYTKYTTDMYRRADGTLPKTYMEYLRGANPNLYFFIKETDEENMVEQIDNLLVALDTFMKTDKFQFLFLNIPTLSLDNIRRFIYYLIDIFKSYTVDLKAMNIIYHINDKRLNNIKLVLQEGNFYKYFEDYSELQISDLMDYLLGRFQLYSDLKIKILDNPQGKFTKEHLLRMFKTFHTTFLKYDEEREFLLSDFADIFDEMDEIFGHDQTMDMLDKAIIQVSLPYIQQYNIKDDFLFQYKIGNIEKIKFIEQNLIDSIMTRKDKIILCLRDKLVSEYYGSMTRELKYQFHDALMPVKVNTEGDIIPYDFGDHLEFEEEILQHNIEMNIREYYYFVRKEG